MEANLGFVLMTCILIATLTTFAAKLLDWVWFRPRKLDKFLRKQGFNGNPYRILRGDLKDFTRVLKEEQPKSVGWSSDDIVPHIFHYYMQTISKYGKNSFMWFGPLPRLNIVDPELIKEILRDPNVFQKPFPETSKILTGGILFLEGEKWAKHRKIINPAFHIDKLKNMVPAMGLSCSKMLNKWKEMVSINTNQGSCEIDVWPYLEDLTGDVIAQTIFGSSNYEEGKRIFKLQQERIKLAMQLIQLLYVPGWGYLPTKANKRVKAISNEIGSLLKSVVEKRHETTDKEKADDLLGILLESNSRFVEQDGNRNAGMSTEDVIEECKAFFFAGSETTSSLLVWTMILLCKYPEWQNKARDEVMRAFGASTPTYEDLSQLKIVTMILYEVIRLYPTLLLVRLATETAKVGDLTIPQGVHITLLTGLLGYDPKIWGDDVKEFKQQRFSEGLERSSFTPFSTGPRFCIGKNFAMIEAKMAVAMMLQQFSFELSPSYVHAPFAIITLIPQYGAPLIVRKLD